MRIAGWPWSRGCDRAAPSREPPRDSHHGRDHRHGDEGHPGSARSRPRQGREHQRDQEESRTRRRLRGEEEMCQARGQLAGVPHDRDQGADRGGGQRGACIQKREHHSGQCQQPTERIGQDERQEPAENTAQRAGRIPRIRSKSISYPAKKSSMPSPETREEVEELVGVGETQQLRARCICRARSPRPRPATACGSTRRPPPRRRARRAATTARKDSGSIPITTVDRSRGIDSSHAGECLRGLQVDRGLAGSEGARRASHWSTHVQKRVSYEQVRTGRCPPTYCRIPHPAAVVPAVVERIHDADHERER